MDPIQTDAASSQFGAVRRANKAVESSVAGLIDATAAGMAAAIQYANAPPAQPVAAEPRAGSRIHVVA